MAIVTGCSFEQSNGPVYRKGSESLVLLLKASLPLFKYLSDSQFSTPQPSSVRCLHQLHFALLNQSRLSHPSFLLQHLHQISPLIPLSTPTLLYNPTLFRPLWPAWYTHSKPRHHSKWPALAVIRSAPARGQPWPQRHQICHLCLLFHFSGLITVFLRLSCQMDTSTREKLDSYY